MNDGNGKLTTEAQAFVADWIDRHGSGVGLLKKNYPAVYRQALAIGMTNEDIERCCEDETIQAALKYDPAKGCFSTILTWGVRSAVQSGIREHLGYHPNARHKPTKITSLDDNLGPSGFTLHDCLSGEETELENELLGDEGELIRRTVLELHDGHRKWEVMRRRLGIGCEAETLNETAKRLKISRERVRQILEHTMADIRRILGSKLEAQPWQ